MIHHRPPEAHADKTDRHQHNRLWNDGWTCRRCANGDHRNCEEEQRGLYCTCVEGECGDAAVGEETP